MIKLSSGHENKSNKSSHKNDATHEKLAREKNSASSSTIVAHFGADSVKMIAESIGIANLSDDATRLIADDITMKLKCVAQDAMKFAVHGRRTMMSVSDIDHSLKHKNIPPMFGYTDKELLPFRFASGGGRELYFQEEKEVDLPDILGMSSLAKLPQDVAIKCHWLSIEGVQPAIPENPPPLSKDRLRLDGIDPSLVLKLQNTPGIQTNKFITQKPKKMVEVIKVKQYATHELSMEQQLYYKEITEACVGSDESRRIEALQSLTYDSGLHQMLPRLCTFISEGVKVNVVQNNLALLIYLMRMVKALLDNHNLYLEKYLHDLIPTVLTCVVSKQLCLRPEQDNHWALRDFGSRLMSQICRNFNTNTNNIQVRVTQLLSHSLDKERIAQSSLYGVIACLCEMGPEVQRAFLLKRVKMIGDRIRTNVEGMNISSADKAAAGHIESLILRNLPTTIKNLRTPPDIVGEYRQDYGYLGPQLHMAVVNLRSKEGSNTHRINISGNSQSTGGSNLPYRRVSNISSGSSTSQQAKYAIISSSPGSSNVGSTSGSGTGSGNVTMYRMIRSPATSLGRNND
ncbi:LOW QUALITY PROTEIN: transcription initiation factor TFIID subunit 6 [Dermatophagoides farinae]|uniref:Transcription initiation factor TFIID subunit 6 n=1 Tax=Dermatophagoides farinae TaxID=6954 RepID=A0A922L8I9_DERFA|nr:transcription initiation factor TFIID subunit 6-like [Dermatophagoides farinae]KAH7646621.1 transcription initiation factor tfiid subunit 6-like protein [Dermatophagoides farinae]KAH9517167.1 Transcription initiation factor TFIID subunit 6 [Dermatophagoides farinae]